MNNSNCQTAHKSTTYGHRFPCSEFWFQLTLVALRLFITVTTNAMFYFYLLSFIHVVLPIVWITEGIQVCHHQSQIKQWPDMQKSVISVHLIPKTQEGVPHKHCLCLTLSFHVWKLRNHFKAVVSHFVMAVRSLCDTRVDLLTSGCLNNSNWEIVFCLRWILCPMKSPKQLLWCANKNQCSHEKNHWWKREFCWLPLKHTPVCQFDDSLLNQGCYTHFQTMFRSMLIICGDHWMH